MRGGDRAHGAIDDVDDGRLAGASPSRLARAVSSALTPAVIVAALTGFVCLRYAPSPSVALAQWALVMVLVVGIPYLFLFREVRRGRVLDHHMVRRSQRMPTLAVAAVCVLAVPFLAVAMGARREVAAVPVAMLVALLLVLAATSRWKVSVHLAVAGAALAIAALIEPRASAFLAPLVLPLGWARVREGRHSVGQVVAGLLLGASVAGGTYALLR